MFIKIGGVPASGKSTIVKSLVAALKEQGIDADFVHGGEIMAQVLGITIEQLRQLPEEKKIGARNKMYEIMYALDRESPNTIRFRDAHFCMFDQGSGEFLVAPLQEGDFKQMKAMIVLEVPPEKIIKRRNHDQSTRVDRKLDFQTVKREIEAELTTAQEQAEVLGIPLIIVKNFSRSPQETCQEIAAKLKKEIFIDPEPKLTPERETGH